MPSRRRVQPPTSQAPAQPPQQAKRQASAPMLPPTLAATVGTARHDRQLAGVRLGASRRLGAHMRQMRQPLSSEQRQRYLEEAAYYRYLQRGGQMGNPETDWLEAEQEPKNSAQRR